MKMRPIGTHLAGALLLAAGLQGTSWAQAPLALRASLDTSATHERTIAVGDYLQKLEAASGGRLKTQLFHSGQLYKDVNVPKALREGSVEMAVPGIWVLSGFVADADMIQLPAFYGQPLDRQQRVFDGPVGRKINAELEQKLAATVIGAWLPLGFSNYYSTRKPLTDFKDLEGMKIRTSGGAGQFVRAKFFGAIPNMTPWPDVPLSLSQGNFDGLSTTNESAASAKLWDSGLHYALEDHEFVGYYIPMVSLEFWRKLPPDLQKLMQDVWAQNIPTYRQKMVAAQEEAHVTLAEHGVKFVTPTEAELAAVRARMMPDQDAIAKELKLTPELVKQATDEVTSGG
jgi:TRAP-type C4-dicarboxylate transport system substrate-binding protein